MKRVDLKRHEINDRDFLKRSVIEDDYTQTIFPDSKLYLDGKQIAIIEKLPLQDVATMRWAAKNVKTFKDYRTDGLNTNSTIFGFSPREPLRKDFCGATAMATKEPRHHSVFVNFANYADKKYREHFPAEYKTHCESLEDTVRDEWLLNGTVFTSGIVNDHNPLKYHYDRGNLKGSLSVMLVLRSGIVGGDLVFPEFKCKLLCDDACLFIFDGQGFVHGVTEMRGRAGSYRYSIVYYSLNGMKYCLSPEEELSRIRKLKTQREKGQTE
jgi:hypothetical protein